MEENIDALKLIKLNGIKRSIPKMDLQKLPISAYLIKYSKREDATVKKILKNKSL